MNVNYGQKSAIFNLFELKSFRAYGYLKPHILFYNNGLAIWHGLPNIRHIEVNYRRWLANKVYRENFKKQ